MNRQRDETGAISIVLAALAMGLVVLALAGANAAGLVGVRREAQRAANLAALAGAANLPLVGLFSGPEPQTTSCAQIDKAFAPSSARLTPELGAGVPRCGAGVTVTVEADWARVDAGRDALALLLGTAALPDDLCDQLLTPLPVDAVLSTLSDAECRSLDAAIDGLPHNLSPALVTPRVAVSVEGLYQAFVPMPAFAGEHSIDAQAAARRRFKNVVVLPAVNGAPQPLDDLNPTAADARDFLLPQLEHAFDALTDAVEPFMPPGVRFDLSGLLLDVSDVYDPPASAPSPSPLEVAAAAVASGDPVVLLRLFDAPVLGIPALDFTAAYLSRSSDGSFRATPVPLTQLAAAPGLFRATLIRPSAATP